MGGRPNGQEIFLYEAPVLPGDSLSVQRRTLGVLRRRAHVAVLHDGTLLTTGLLEEILGIQLPLLIGECGRSVVDHLEREAALQRLLVRGVSDGLVRSAHDCAEGGLAVTLAECCFNTGFGADADIPAIDAGASEFGEMAALFSEYSSSEIFA